MNEHRRLSEADLLAQVRRRATDGMHSDRRIQFVAGVRAKIDADSRPVSSRRAPALAGLAGAAAILIVLVVALTTLRPGLTQTPRPGETQIPASIAEGSATPGVPTSPPSDSPEAPNVGEVPVLTAVEFARSLRANELDRQQVLVEGGIVAGPPIPRPVCYPGVIDGHTCYLGEIEGIEPAIIVAAPWLATPESEASARFNEPRIEWPHWWFPTAPVRGLLLMSVRRGTVDYLGRVHRNAESLTWSVDEAKEVDPGSLAPDEILLGDGWLTGFGGILSCLAPPADLIAGLPERWCANSGWLVDSANRSLLSGDDRDSGIELQDKAYYEFAPAPEPDWIGSGDGEPRKGTYALAPRLEGWCAHSEPPCWQWSVVGRVADDLSGVAPRTIECGYPTLAGRGSPVPSGMPVCVRDETGQVRGCIAGLAPQDVLGVVVENPLPNAVTLNVSWPGTICDLSTDLTFRETASGYELVGETQTASCPDDTTVRHSVMIMMAEAVPAGSVYVSIDGVIGVQPTPTPVPEPSVIPCTTDGHHATLLDQTGYIDACRTTQGTVPVESIVLLNHDDIGVFALRVLWAGSACDDTPVFRLYQTGMRFALEGELQAEPCGAEDIPYEVQLVLNTDLLAQSIDASMRRVSGPAPTRSPAPPVASEEFDTSVGTFEITARAGKSTYETGEPIDITGEILWKGSAGSTLEIFGGNTQAAPGIVHFGWEQLGGDLRIGPIFRRSCQSTVLEAGAPITGAIAKELGNFGDREHDEFWGEFFSDPEFTLPPGRYRVMARALFSVGECGGDQIGLHVPIVINVTD